MSGKRILIVTSSPLCRNPRVLKEANTLGHSGYVVSVLTMAGREDDEAFDRELLAGAPFQKITVPYFGFHGLLGLSAHTSRALTSLARELVPLGIEGHSALGPFHRLHDAACRQPADLTIVHTELGLAVGCELLKQGKQVAADIEDWHSQDLLPAARSNRPLRLLKKYEHSLLHEATFTTTTSLAMAAALHSAYGGTKPSVITNSFPLQPKPQRDQVGQPPRLFWFSQTVGPGRGLELFLTAWIRTKKPSRLVLLGEPQSGYCEYLRDRLPGGQRDLIQFHPRVSPAELPSVITQHDIGLAMEELNPANKNLTISNKILQYLNAGLAVVASSTAGHREVIAKNPSAGILVEAHETTAFARALDELLADHVALAARQQAARRLAEETYCWERETPQLLALVEEALGKTSKPA